MRATVSGRPPRFLDPDREWCDLASLVWVECERRCGDQVTTDTAASSPAYPQSRSLLQVVRQHETIENAHHWVLDIAFDEDNSRIRTGHAAHNMTISGVSPTSGWQRLGTRTTGVGWLASSPNPFGCNYPVPWVASALCRCTSPRVGKRIHTSHSSDSA